jgi:hypothetical protein
VGRARLDRRAAEQHEQVLAAQSQMLGAGVGAGDAAMLQVIGAFDPELDPAALDLEVLGHGSRRQPVQLVPGGLRPVLLLGFIEAPLRHRDLSIAEVDLALFTQHPRKARWTLILRGWIVRPLGLRTTTAPAFDSIEIKPAYEVGE